MRLPDLRHHLRALGAAPTHEGRLLRRWAKAQPLGSGKRRAEDFLPRTVRDGLPAFEALLASLARVRSTHPDDDGAERLLVALADGQTVESVLLPRDGLCVSSQIGCAVGCRFCMTGRDGLLRQLGSAEIVAQVVLGRQRRAVKKVVFMGMGEPAHNLGEVMDAIDFLGTDGSIAHKQLVVSTVGDARVFERLPQGPVKPALALSLHSTFEDRRRDLLPRAPALDIGGMVDAAERYARATGYPIQYQWTLLDGLNDGDDELDRLAALLHGKLAMVNFIPYNANEGLPFRRTDTDRAVAMTRFLNGRGVLTRLRWSAGQAVDGGCGQLRARARAVVPIAAA